MASSIHLLFLFIVLVNGNHLISENVIANNRQARIRNLINTMSSVKFMARIIELSSLGDQPILHGGGALIGPKTILTSAQSCKKTYNDNQSAFIIRTGGPTFKNERYLGTVNKILIHPNYTSSNLAYDFCIMTLTKAVANDTKLYQFIRIADRRPEYGTEVHFTGWGETGPGKNGSQTLKYLNLRFVQGKLCQSEFDNDQFKILPEIQVCATSESGSLCSKDVGGPLFTGWGKNAELVGIASRPKLTSNKCPENSSKLPNVFGNPVNVRKWIMANTM